MQREEPNLIEKTLLMAAALAVVYGFVAAMFSLEPKNAPQAPATTGNGSSSLLLSGQPAALSDYDKAIANVEREFPLPYTATITQYGDGIDEPRTRFYVPKGKK